MSGQRVLASAVLVSCLFGYLRAGTGQTTAQPLLNLEGDTEDPSVSPDGKSIAFVWTPPDETKWGIYISPASGGVPDLLVGVDDRGLPLSPKWSRDGKWIAFLRTGSAEQAGLFVKSRVSGVERFLGVVCNDREVWSANGDSVIASALHPSTNTDLDLQELCTFPIKPGAHSRELGVFGSSPAVSRDGKMLAFVHNGAIRLLPLTPDARPAGPAKTLLHEASGIFDLTWDATKNQILYVPAEDRSRIRRAVPGSGSTYPDVANVEGEILSLESTSDGRLLAGVMRRESSL
jgi:Tol biopolymer transport system component